MSNKFICGGNKFELGGQDVYESIGLPVSVAGLPPKITVEGCELTLRPELHVSLVCFGKIIEKHKISILDFADKIVEDFCCYAQTNEIGLLKYRNEFRFVSKGEKRTVVVMCDISNLSGFFDLINKKYSLQIEYPPTHVTLYTLLGVPGIFLVNSKDLKEFTKVISNPIGVDL